MRAPPTDRFHAPCLRDEADEREGEEGAIELRRRSLKPAGARHGGERRGMNWSVFPSEYSIVLTV